MGDMSLFFSTINPALSACPLLTTLFAEQMKIMCCISIKLTVQSYTLTWMISTLLNFRRFSKKLLQKDSRKVKRATACSKVNDYFFACPMLVTHVLDNSISSVFIIIPGWCKTPVSDFYMDMMFSRRQLGQRQLISVKFQWRTWQGFPPTNTATLCVSSIPKL